MSRPRLLDLCCKAGGASMGYHLAGWDVEGVDIDPQPRYPFTFHQSPRRPHVLPPKLPQERVLLPRRHRTGLVRPRPRKPVQRLLLLPRLWVRL